MRENVFETRLAVVHCRGEFRAVTCCSSNAALDSTSRVSPFQIIRTNFKNANWHLTLIFHPFLLEMLLHRHWGILHFNSNKCFKLSTGHYRRQHSVLRGRLFPLENGATVVDEKSVTRGGVCLHHWEECK